MSAYCDFHDSNNSRCSLNVPGKFTGYCMVWKGECPYEDARRKALEDRKTLYNKRKPKRTRRASAVR